MNTPHLVAMPGTFYERHLKQGAFRLGKLRGKKFKAEDYGVFRLFKFAESCFKKAAAIGQSMGLVKNHIAVHWRSERTRCRYNACAKEMAAGIQRAIKAETGIGGNASGCLLVSDIPVNPDRSLWGKRGGPLSRVFVICVQRVPAPRL